MTSESSVHFDQLLLAAIFVALSVKAVRYANPELQTKEKISWNLFPKLTKLVQDHTVNKIKLNNEKSSTTLSPSKSSMLIRQASTLGINEKSKGLYLAPKKVDLEDVMHGKLLQG